MTKPKTLPEPAPKPAKKTPARAPGPVDLGDFGAPPKGTTHWGLGRHMPDGSIERLSAPSPDGLLLVREWPLSELTRETIAARWGEGQYRLQWRGAGTKGGRAFLGWGPDFGIASGVPVPAASAAPAPAIGMPTDVFGMALRLNDQIAERAAIAAQRDRDFLSAHTAATNQLLASFLAMGQQRQAEDGALRQVGTLLERMDQRLSALEAGRAPDDEEEEEDEDEDEDDAPGGGVFRVGEPKGEQAVVAALNAAVAAAGNLAPGAIEVAAEWLETKKREMAAARAASDASAKQLTNGAAAAE